MQATGAFFKQKLVLGSAVAVLVVLMVFGLAMMGSVIGAQPKSLPVALVVLDQPVAKPDGQKVAVGEVVKARLLEQTQLPIAWKVLGSEAEALEGMDRQDYYGALVLPADLSGGMLSLQTAAPQTGTIRIYVNEGKNAQVAGTVRTMLQTAMQNVGSMMTKQMIAEIGQKTPQIPAQAVGALLEPFKIDVQSVHPIGSNNANGGAPVMLTQIIWLGSLVVSIMLFLSAQQAIKTGGGRGATVASQLTTGLVWIIASSAFLLWMASAWYGMEIADWGSAWLFLALSGAAFFLLQTALLRWIGMAAIPLLVLLFFFSMPVMNLAPEMLPQASQDWLYSWTPFRFVAGGLRTIMYFDGVGIGDAYQTVGWLAGVSLVIAAASAFKPIKAGTKAAAKSA